MSTAFDYGSDICGKTPGMIPRVQGHHSYNLSALPGPGCKSLSAVCKEHSGVQSLEMNLAVWLRPNFTQINPRILWGLFVLCGLLFYFSSRREP